MRRLYHQYFDFFLLLLGFAWGLSWLWFRGGVFDTSMSPTGYNWTRYLLSGWALEHNPRLFNNYREPLYYWMLGYFGEMIGSYRTVAIMMSSLSVTIMLACCGYIGRFFGGAWVSMVAMMVFPWVAIHRNAVGWMNSYPLLGAWMAMMICVALYVSSRKKGVFGVLILGALCGLGLWIDQRVLLFIPVSIALLMYRLVRQRSVWVLVAFAISFGGAWNIGSWSDGRERTLLVETKMEQQRAVVQRFQRFRGLKDSCGHIPKSDLLTVPYLGSDCAKATLVDNVEYRFSMSHVYGMWGWWMMGAMSLLAFVYRPWVYRILCFGVGIPTVIWMMWTPFPDRYMMLMAVPLSALGTVSVMGGRLFSKNRFLKGAIVGCALAWTWNMDWNNRERYTELKRSKINQLQSLFVEILDKELRSEDHFMDCSRSGIESAFLPNTHHAQLIVQNKQEGEACSVYIQENGTRTQWLLKGEDDKIYPQLFGWDVFAKKDKITLWRRVP